MKRRLQFLLIAALVLTLAPTAIDSVNAVSSTACGSTVRKANGTAWTCRFADEFSGTQLDRSKWVAQRTAIGGNSGNEADCWVDTPNNISVANGTLRLTSRKEAVPFVCNSPHGRYSTYYSSGSVSTWGKFQQTYGRWQIRAKFPAATVTGSQGALWLFPKDQAYGDWPKSGEIDIAEFYSRLPDRVIPKIHYHAKGRANRTTTNKKCMVDSPSSFHVYTAEWTSTSIRIWIDSKLCVDHTIRARRPLSGAQPFDKPFATYLTQSLGVGQNRFRDFGRIKTPLPLRTEVDWVHIWS
jgi:beta-glucanase (GH16 family)